MGANAQRRRGVRDVHPTRRKRQVHCSLCKTKPLRVDNKSGMCGKCYQSAEGQRARYVPRPRREMHDAIRHYMALGVQVGHQWAPLEPDTEPRSWLTQCVRCDGWLAIDGDEQTTPYGNTVPEHTRRDDNPYMLPCVGKLARAAERRDPFAMSNSFTSLSDVPADPEASPVIIEHNWTNSEVDFGQLSPLSE